MANYPNDPAQGGKAAMTTSGNFMETVQRLGFTPRQQMLDANWQVYRCHKYDICAIDWDGTAHMDHVELEAVMRAQFIPPGFYDAGQTQPMKFRRPRAPYHLPKVIVERFTGLLFSQRRHPQIRFEGDPQTEDFVQALAEQARLWPNMMRARNWGGGCGSACVGFKFVNGKAIIEVFNPIWTTPQFSNLETLEVKRIEIRYIYPSDHDPQTGELHRNKETNAVEEVAYWYRRLITVDRDTIWKPIRVDDGDEPDWNDPTLIDEDVAHNLGECPVVWIPNLRVEGSFDGDPDFYGIEDMSKEIDILMSQASAGTIANCDPTTVVSSDEELLEVAKGSDNAIKLEKGGEAKYMEMSAEGIKAARELAHEMRALALEVAACVMDHPQQGADRTATEINRIYDMMWAKADQHRENYGEQGVKRLLEKMLRAAKRTGEPRLATDGQAERGVLLLPPKISRDASAGDEGDPKVTVTPRQLGPYADQGQITLLWPQYHEPPITDIETAVRAAAEAVDAGLIDEEHAVNFLANYFHVEDVRTMMVKIKKERAERQQQQAQTALGELQRMGGSRAIGGAPPAPGGGSNGAPKLSRPSGFPPRRVVGDDDT